MAARDRFGALGEPAPSVLQRYIQNACDPQNFEPNLALDLEISDLINSKKGNAPREAAVGIVNYINHRNPNVSLLALALLDICVKNCGYPFHLQISTKEFLNELVRRFPERPPARSTRVQQKILEAIEEWRQTICQTSRYKEDLGFIRDMHRLLSYKGYMFPEVRREDAAVLNPSDNLKSAEEMEEEERAAQSAKLQELIRRGGPQDLQEANKLMKVMAGYDTRHKTDYRAKAAEEVGKIQQKAKILEEMLQGYKQGDKMTEGDVFEELANALSSAQPKIQKMCEEESDDSEAVAKLLEINDSIHRTVERYKLIKKGDVDAATKIPKGTLGTTTGVSKTADNELSLIDLGGDPEPSANGAASSSSAGNAQKTDSLEDDLLGLSFQDNNYGQGGGIALGFGSPTIPSSPPQMPTNPQFPTMSPPPQSWAQAQPAKPNYDVFASLTGSRPASQSVTPTPPPFHPQQQPQSQPPKAASPAPPATVDPFAALSSSVQRQVSPFHFQDPPAPHTSNLFGQAPPSALAQPPVMPSAAPAPADDEWTFSSALPEQGGLPTSTTVNATPPGSDFNINLSVTRQDAVIAILATLTNATDQPITDLTLQVAVMKGFSLKLEPQSGRDLSPRHASTITQVMHLHGVERGRGNAVRVRWKASYKIGMVAKDIMGDIPSLGVV